MPTLRVGAINMIVYIYVFPDGKRYVGQTKNTPESRAGGLSAANYQSNPELYAAFKECGGYENVPRYDIKVNTQEEADKIERTLITAFNPAYNRKAGNKPSETALSCQIRKARKSTESILKAKRGTKNPLFDTTLQTLAEKYSNHPEWNSTTPYSRAEIKEWFSSNTLTSAKNKGFIDNSQRGKYYLKFIDILKGA